MPSLEWTQLARDGYILESRYTETGWGGYDCALEGQEEFSRVAPFLLE